MPSFPLWERGLKSSQSSGDYIECYVVPLVGTWIEINYTAIVDEAELRSFPLWERGLK